MNDLNDYFEFLKFPSISSEPEYNQDMLNCAVWVQNYLNKIGMQTELWKTSGHPVIFASWLEAGPEKPTLLIYHHYDVQPVDPLELWETPPFEPVIRQGEVYARGAQDNKGQCFYTLHALKMLFQKNHRLPINIKLCIEGEEECGSTGLATLLETKKDALKADYLAIVDLGIPGPNSPTITLGIRGILTLDLEVTGSKTDMHSGSNGGLLYNPIHAITKILAELRDDQGRITIPGFYNQVLPLDQKARAHLSFSTFDALEYEKMFGTVPSGGEIDYAPIERNWLRPTLEINGISGGYTGDGFKTVIPSKAFAKISCRLVPDQAPELIGQLIIDHLEKNAPKGTKVEARFHHGGGKAVRSNPNSKVVKAFAQAFTEIFQKPCQFILEGASIPIVTELAFASESEVVLVGLGLPDDQIHAPNEHFGIDRLEKGSAIIQRALELLATAF